MAEQSDVGILARQFGNGILGLAFLGKHITPGIFGMPFLVESHLNLILNRQVL